MPAAPRPARLPADRGGDAAAVRRRHGGAGHLLLAAEAEGQIVGLLHAFVRPAIENPREAVVQAIVVDEGRRGRGVGKALMAAAERWGREQGCPFLMLSSNVARAPAHAFYKALGYRVSATAYVLRKDLRA